MPTYYQLNKERLNARSKEYYRLNRERIKARARERKRLKRAQHGGAGLRAELDGDMLSAVSKQYRCNGERSMRHLQDVCKMESIVSTTDPLREVADIRGVENGQSQGF